LIGAARFTRMRQMRFHAYQMLEAGVRQFANGAPATGPAYLDRRCTIFGGAFSDCAGLEATNWPPHERVEWLEAAARCFDLMYAGGDGRISVTGTKDS
jgi:hypothetical protein